MSRMRTLAAEPQAVWKVLADFGALSSWARNVDHSCLLEHGDDGVGVGTSRRVQVGRNTLVERVTDVIPGSTLAYDIEGLPHEEIARITGASVGTVRSRLFYARQMLQGLLSEYVP